ncbi:superoxide dismutase, Cu-Zn family [Deinococcus reticulitermitis]|uniref:Superoxide dismutase, Cu-Zn family n=1 Tax=Deinococcus reticulitermitis TaxID=856736 RepID=A0A1H6S4J9_9DEIO|nr:superoxide dismutase family protein [Deinococcus reticulitermitis]SEI58655.1 superoxide dismutase, Cu-Zn family [Deinococcus reticulitermitis]
MPSKALRSQALGGVLAGTLALLLTGCTDLGQPHARADLIDTEGKITGNVRLLPEIGGTRVLVEVSGLKPGQHGMHIHVNPSCDPGPDPSGNTIPFGAAGGHFDPGDSGNHDQPTTPNDQGHGGDLPMITVGTNGRGSANFKTTKVKMSGAESVLGRSVIIHADPDDYATDPAGNTGARERCGIFRS